MIPRVLISEPLPHADIAISSLKPHALVKVSNVFESIVESDKLKACTAVIVGDSRITKESIRKAKSLKIIQKCGAGIDTIDLESCSKKGIAVCNIPGVNAIDVAEYTVAAMVSSLRNFRQMDKAARKAAWNDRPSLIGERLQNKKIGIIGLGKIGRRIVSLLKPFEVQIMAFDPYIRRSEAEEIDVIKVNLETLLKESDIVTVHAPLTFETRNLLGKPELSLMKSTAVLINTARGGIINETSLHRVLKEQKIGYAVIDVWDKEPVNPGNPIFQLENVQLSLHTASWTNQVFLDLMKLSAENVIRVIKGKEPFNIVNKRA